MGQVEINRRNFSHYNVVRMREALRYLSDEKLEAFIKIPFLLQVNVPGYPGYVDARKPPRGIWHFEQSGFYNEAVKMKLFPKSVIAAGRVKDPAILAFYHMGSLGTFTQSNNSDFDYWVIIDKKKFDDRRVAALEMKLDDIVRHCRESYGQQVSFFVMDYRKIRNDEYGLSDDNGAFSVPKIFLKEEFYRTYLMIAGKIPLWSVMPKSSTVSGLNAEGIRSQVLGSYDDLIDLGGIESPPVFDIFKGLLWHICKAKEDPVKALIKATMIYSYGFSQKTQQTLLCDTIREGYPHAGIDDFSMDPYKILFDRILKFHEQESTGHLNLIKNAIFLRLCGYPDVRMPPRNTPKHHLLSGYIKAWGLQKKQVAKLLAFKRWSEAEKLLLEKTIIQRLAGMYNEAQRLSGAAMEKHLRDPHESRNLQALKHKVKERLNRDPRKIQDSSVYIRRRSAARLKIDQTGGDAWELSIQTDSGRQLEKVFKHPCFAGIFGWILVNGLYRRSGTVFELNAHKLFFEGNNQKADLDHLFLDLATARPASDEEGFGQPRKFVKMMVVLYYGAPAQGGSIEKAELLAASTWGEFYVESIKTGNVGGREGACREIAEKIAACSSTEISLIICQFSDQYDPDIVYLLKKAYIQLTAAPEEKSEVKNSGILLDKL